MRIAALLDPELIHAEYLLAEALRPKQVAVALKHTHDIVIAYLLRRGRGVSDGRVHFPASRYFVLVCALLTTISVSRGSARRGFGRIKMLIILAVCLGPFAMPVMKIILSNSNHTSFVKIHTRASSIYYSILSSTLPEK